MNLKEFGERAIRHGEALLVPIDSLPAKAKLKKTCKEFVVAHSETGHHHVLTAPRLRVYELDNELYLDVEKVGQLDHQKTTEKHATKVVQPGFYKIQIKKAYDYFQKKMTQVRD